MKVLKALIVILLGTVLVACGNTETKDTDTTADTTIIETPPTKPPLPPAPETELEVDTTMSDKEIKTEQ